MPVFLKLGVSRLLPMILVSNTNNFRTSEDIVLYSRWYVPIFDLWINDTS